MSLFWRPWSRRRKVGRASRCQARSERDFQEGLSAKGTARHVHAPQVIEIALGGLQPGLGQGRLSPSLDRPLCPRAETDRGLILFRCGLGQRSLSRFFQLGTKLAVPIAEKMGTPRADLHLAAERESPGVSPFFLPHVAAHAGLAFQGSCRRLGKE